MGEDIVNSNLAVLAVGGNSLIKDKDRVALSFQYQGSLSKQANIADLIKEGLNLVITHGNGPQVGFIYRRGEIARHELPLIPLDICGADTQGAIGFMIQKALMNHFREMGISKKTTTVVTQTLVNSDDPSFQRPTKPIGSFMSEQEALKNRVEFGWEVMEDAGRGFRRVVPSPIPREIIEMDVIKLLVKEGYIVVAVGGGGIPVIRKESGNIESVEAVIDKDLASSLLARNIGADTLIISTAVDTVYLNYGMSDQTPIHQASLSEVKQYLAEGHFKPGSMKPKIESIIQFLEGGGERKSLRLQNTFWNRLGGDAGRRL